MSIDVNCDLGEGMPHDAAILPFISYRTFEPEEREKALGWVLTGEDS